MNFSYFRFELIKKNLDKIAILYMNIKNLKIFKNIKIIKLYLITYFVFNKHTKNIYLYKNFKYNSLHMKNVKFSFTENIYINISICLCIFLI